MGTEDQVDMKKRWRDQQDDVLFPDEVTPLHWASLVLSTCGRVLCTCSPHTSANVTPLHEKHLYFPAKVLVSFQWSSKWTDHSQTSLDNSSARISALQQKLST